MIQTRASATENDQIVLVQPIKKSKVEGEEEYFLNK